MKLIVQSFDSFNNIDSLFIEDILEMIKDDFFDFSYFSLLEKYWATQNAGPIYLVFFTKTSNTPIGFSILKKAKNGKKTFFTSLLKTSNYNEIVTVAPKEIGFAFKEWPGYKNAVRENLTHWLEKYQDSNLDVKEIDYEEGKIIHQNLVIEKQESDDKFCQIIEPRKHKEKLYKLFDYFNIEKKSLDHFHQWSWNVIYFGSKSSPTGLYYYQYNDARLFLYPIFSEKNFSEPEALKLLAGLFDTPNIKIYRTLNLTAENPIHSKTSKNGFHAER